jgi:hemerythrin
MLVWREQMSVANAIIDSDHRYLLCLINAIELTCRTQQPEETLRLILQQLVEYTDFHFRREERIQLAIGFGHLAQHEMSHQNMREYLKEICAEFEKFATERESVERLEHLLDWSRRWLVEHLLKEDMLMKPYLARLPQTFVA